MGGALEPLEDFTDMLSGNHCVCIKPVLHILKTEALKVSDSDTNLIKSMKRKIWDYLQNKYNDADIDGLLNVCTYLDPRFKSMYIDDDLDIALVKDRLARESVKIIEEQTCQSASGNTAVTMKASENASATSTNSNPSKKCKLSAWLKEAAVVQAPSGSCLIPEQKIKKEIEEFDRLQLLDSELDLLQWWKVHEIVLPTLSKLAQKYLCICASSLASEQIFSCSGNIVSKKR